MASDIDTLLCELRNSSVENITNEMIIELYEKIGKSKSHKYQEIVNVLQEECTVDQFRGRVANLKKLKKTLRGDAASSLRKEPFTVFPSASKAAIGSQTKILSYAFEDIITKTENEILRSKNESLVERLKISDQKMEELRRIRKSQTRKIKQLNDTLSKKRNSYQELRRKNIGISKRLVNLQSQNSDVTKIKLAELKRIVSKLKNENKHLMEQVVNFNAEKDNLESSFQQKISDLNDSLSYTESLLNDDVDNVLYIFDNHNYRYTNEFQLCVMNLLSHGVGVHHINNVIEAVASLCRKEVDKSHIPSVRTINRIGDQRLSISHMHMAEQLSEKSNTTLMSDETRKHGDCYEMFSVQDYEGRQWVLGLKEMQNKSSESCLDALKVITDDISISSSTDCGKKILGQIKNTMSDRAATEKRFHELLQSYRESILPSIYSNWDELSAEEQQSLTKLNNFYCGLHLLVNFAEVSDKVISDYEKSILDVPIGAGAKTETARFVSKEESGAIRLIRTASKCFARGADEKNGCYRDFRTFINTKSIDEEYSGKDRTSLLVPFRGNRFNIIFYNAEIVYYLSQYIKELFNDVHIPQNLLQKAVFYDIQENTYLAICKALGLCSKLITAPFWRIMESNCSLQDASTAYQKLALFLSSAKADASNFVCGTHHPFADYVKEDYILETLLTQNEKLDFIVASVLQPLFSAWEAILQKAASQHLEGGEFANVEGPLEETTKSVPRHNKFPERVFALLDALTRFKPVASVLCNEAFILFSLNKTYDWLNTLDIDIKHDLINKARTGGRDLRQKYKERSKEIELIRQQSLKQKRAEIARKREKDVINKEAIVNEVQYFGFWQYPETIENNMKTLKTTALKKTALKAQLRFRKAILHQETIDQKVFQFSEKGKEYSVETLNENLTTLVNLALQRKEKDNSSESIFISKRIKHYFTENDMRTPYFGRVISAVPGYPEWINVIYDDDLAVYVYKLGEEYRNGDLEIVPETEVNLVGSYCVGLQFQVLVCMKLHFMLVFHIYNAFFFR